MRSGETGVICAQEERAFHVRSTKQPETGFEPVHCHRSGGRDPAGADRLWHASGRGGAGAAVRGVPHPRARGIADRRGAVAGGAAALQGRCGQRNLTRADRPVVRGDGRDRGAVRAFRGAAHDDGRARGPAAGTRGDGPDGPVRRYGGL